MNFISKISVTTILCFFLITGRTYADTMCGEVGSDTVSGYRCMESIYGNDSNFPSASLDTNFNYVCVNYSTSGYDSNNGTSYLNDCYVPYGGYRCWNSYYYDDSGCLACPNNTLASDSPYDNGHTSRSCDYCNDGYYKQDDYQVCLLCPDGGLTNEKDADAPAYAPSIESCFLPLDFDGKDSTGTFTYTSNCYWSK